MKFRKKPIVIEAERFQYAVKPWPEGVMLANGTRLGFMTNDEMPAIKALEYRTEIRKARGVEGSHTK